MEKKLQFGVGIIFNKNLRELYIGINKPQNMSDSYKLELDIYSYITVSYDYKNKQKQIHSASKWFSEEYYVLTEYNGYLIIKKCYFEIPIRASKLAKNNSFKMFSEMPNGKFQFNIEESNEDELIIYY